MVNVGTHSIHGTFGTYVFSPGQTPKEQKSRFFRRCQVPGIAFSGFSEDGLNQAQRDPNQAVRRT